MNEKYIDLQQPIHSKIKPLVIRVIIDGKQQLTQYGPVDGRPAVEDYILLSELPTDLQGRVRKAIEFIISGV